MSDLFNSIIKAISDVVDVKNDGPIPKQIELQREARSGTRVGRTLDNASDGGFLNPKNVVKEVTLKDDKFRRGDHIKANRVGYSHHGISLGGGLVIHYLGTGVTIDSLSDFKNGCRVTKVRYTSKYNSDEICSRAKSRMGEGEYNLVFNNCEHFARWCRGDMI